MNFKETYDIYLKTVEEWLETNIPLGMPDRIIPRRHRMHRKK